MIENSTTCVDFWKATATIHGMDYKEFLTKYDSNKMVHKIDIPIFSMNSVDDELCPSMNVPEEEIKKNKNIIHLKVNGGAHISYYSGTFFPRLFGFELGVDYLGVFEEKRVKELMEEEG